MRINIRLLGLVGLLTALSLIPRGGSAQITSLVRVQHDSFISYYDKDLHIPMIVCYLLESRHFSGSEKVGGHHFKIDTKLPRPRVKDGDYTNSGFVRGHMVAAGDRDSKKSWLKETYLTSNLVPMTMVLNSGPWKQIEDSVRLLSVDGHRLKVVKVSVDRYRESTEACNTSVARWIVRDRFSICVPDGFLCLVECLDCPLARVWGCWQRPRECITIHESTQLMKSVRPDVSLILKNILRSWNHEE